MRQKVLWWCMWGMGSIFWLVVIIQIVLAKSETVIIKADSNNASTHSVMETVPPESSTVTVSDSTVEKDDKTSESISADHTTKDNHLHKKDACINVNSALADELVSLTGIGPVLAQRIVEFRKENGNFKDASDLLKVKGIGEGKLKKIRDYICF